MCCRCANGMIAAVVLSMLVGCGAAPSTAGRVVALPTAALHITPVATIAAVLVPTLPAPTATPAPSVTPAPTAEAQASAAAPGTPDAQKLALLELVNQLRAQNGCPSLQADPILAQTAQTHADDMRNTSVIDHTGSDGSRLKDRLDRVGYPYQLYGENIAASYSTPQEVMTMWTEGDENPSGPHRLNILNCNYTEAGVGLAYNGEGYAYWALDLANRRSE